MIDRQAIEAAARILVAARTTGTLAERLPAASRPASPGEASLIQDAVTRALGDRVVGWKVSAPPDLGLMTGSILASRLFTSGASVPAKLVPGLGVEAEIGFLFDRGLPARAKAYSRDEIEAAATAVVGIEIVDSRFREGTKIPAIERAADFMSNGGYVIGTIREDFRNTDLAALAASLVVNGKRIVDRRVGAHQTVDPILLAIDLANHLRTGTGIAPGQVITTGTYTGIEYAKPGDRVEAVFDNFGEASVRFE